MTRGRPSTRVGRPSVAGASSTRARGADWTIAGSGWRTSLLASLALLWAVIAVLVLLVVLRDEGCLTLAIDDAYIHLAIARNLAEHGVWGVTSHEFTPADSSLLWPMLLATTCAVLGSSAWNALLLNLVAASLILVTTQHLLRIEAPRASGRQVLLALVAVMFGAGMAPVTLTGMEHNLHAWLTLLLVLTAARLLEQPSTATRHTPIGLLLLALFLPAVRYEGFVSILCVGSVLFLRGRRGLGLLAIATGLVPSTVHGLLAWSQGWFWLPTPVLLKASRPDLGSLAGIARSLYDAYQRALRAPDVLFLLLTIGLVFLFQQRRGLRPSEHWSLGALVFGTSASAQLLVGRTGALYRYDYFLVVLGLSLIAAHILQWSCEPRATRWPTLRRPSEVVVAALLVGFVSIPFVAQRGLMGLVNGVRACGNTYRQMVQMGRFAQEHYAGATIAANDIGALCFLADVRLVDLVGLAEKRSAELRLNGTYSPERMRELCDEHGVRIAIAYPDWYTKPDSWQLVGTWEIASNVGVAQRLVAFYAVASGEAPRLIESLRSFSEQLPDGVREDGAYVRIRP